MAELIHSISGTTEENTVLSGLAFPLAVESAFGAVFVGISGDVVRSNEGDDKNWTTEGAGLTGKITALKLHTDGFLYAGTDGGRLYRKNTLTGSWSQVGSAQSTIFHQIASKSGDDIFIAAEDGDVYTSDGSTLTSDHTTGETSVKGVAVWDNKVYASTTAAKIFAKDSSWWQQGLPLSGDSIDYIWRLLEVDGKLTGIADNGFHYIHDGLIWRKNKISDGLMQAHAVYLDREVASNSSGDIFFYENSKWKRKHTFASNPAVGMTTHKGRLITVISGDNVVKSINFPKLINDGNDSWTESEPNKIGLLGSVKRDGAISEVRNYKGVGQTNINGTLVKGTLAIVETQLQLIQQATERREFKLWFDEDKYKFGRKSNFVRSPIKDNIQRYQLSIVHDDPYRYANQFKFSHLELAWADEALGISQTSGDTDLDFGKTTQHVLRQHFIATHSTISKMTIKTAANTGTPSGDIVCTIRDEFNNVKDTVTVVSGDWSTESEIDLGFQHSPIQIGLEYNLMFSGDQAFDDANYRSVSGSTLSNQYQGGQYEHGSGDTFTKNISGDIFFKAYYCTKTITVNNSGNAHAQPRIKMLADSGDLIDTRIINTEPEGRTSFFRFSKKLVQTGTIIFDSEKRQVLGAGSDTANFFTGDFIEFPKGDNVVKIESAPARYQIEHRDTFL